MPPAALLDLLEQDVGMHILDRLPLKALASLTASCRSLRALLNAAYPAWRQAAQLSGYSASHPVLAASSVPAYLRRQHTVHRNIASGCCTVRHATPRRGCRAAPDCTKYAISKQHASPEEYAARPCNVLLIKDLLTGETLESWPLPSPYHTRCRLGNHNEWRWSLD